MLKTKVTERHVHQEIAVPVCMAYAPSG